MIVLIQLASIVSNGNKTESVYKSYIVTLENGRYNIITGQKYLRERTPICRMGERDN